MKNDYPDKAQGEDMNVRIVHGAIWREHSRPRELLNATPPMLRHFYVLMFFIGVMYVIILSARWDWNEYDERQSEHYNYLEHKRALEKSGDEANKTGN